MSNDPSESETAASSAAPLAMAREERTPLIEPFPEIAPVPRPDPIAVYNSAIHDLTPKVWLTPAIIAINVAVFLGMVVTGVGVMEPSIAGLLNWGANFGPRTTGGEAFRLFSSMFVHIGLIHILLNMIVLADIGWFMERILGRGGFLVLYVFAGLSGSLASVAWNPFQVSAGASGAIFGLYGGLFAYLLCFRDVIPSQSLAGLRKGAMTFIGYNLVYGFVREGIDVSAHLGGLAGGFLMGLIVCHAPTVAAAAGRPRRALAGMLVGALVVVSITLTLPNTPDVDSALDRFAGVENQVVDAYNRALDETRQGKLDDEQFANRIEQDVLRPWRAARAPLTALKGLPSKLQAVVDKFVRYLDARTLAWELSEKGLLQHDKKMLAEGMKKLESSAEIIKGKEIR